MKKKYLMILVTLLFIVILGLTYFLLIKEKRVGKPIFEEPIIGNKADNELKPFVIQDSFKDLYKQNNDVVGWIKVNNTNIDYPIVQTKDNNYYLKKDFDKKYSINGSIYLDYRSDFTNMYESAHQIVYGHNMSSGVMFQNLTYFENKDFYNENKIITVNTLYGNYLFEVFSVYETPISFLYIKTNFYTRTAWLDFINEVKDKSMHESDIELKEEDVVLTLSTCTNRHDSNYRFVIHAKLLNPEQYDTEYEYMY